MDPGALNYLESLILDAFSASELEFHLDRWQPDISHVVVRPCGISPQQYAHNLVSEIWRRRMWTGEHGFLTYLAGERVHRLDEFMAIMARLEAPAPPPPSAPPSDRPSDSSSDPLPRACEHVERVESAVVDVLALVDQRLRRAADPFWRAAAPLFEHLRPGCSRQLRLGVDPPALVIEATPRLLQIGQPLHASVVRAVPHDRQPALKFTYCPYGRGVRQAFSLVAAPGRCTVSGTHEGRTYDLRLELTQ